MNIVKPGIKVDEIVAAVGEPEAYTRCNTLTVAGIFGVAGRIVLKIGAVGIVMGIGALGFDVRGITQISGRSIADAYAIAH
jgi:hypothetical protein